MYKEDVALNNLQWFLYHKTQPNQTNGMYFCTHIMHPPYLIRDTYINRYTFIPMHVYAYILHEHGHIYATKRGESPCSVVANALDCDKPKPSL